MVKKKKQFLNSEELDILKLKENKFKKNINAIFFELLQKLMHKYEYNRDRTKLPPLTNTTFILINMHTYAYKTISSALLIFT